MLHHLDHVVLPVPSLAAAAEPFERLGLRLTLPAAHPGFGTENRVFFVGDSHDTHVCRTIVIEGGRRVLAGVSREPDWIYDRPAD